MEAHGKWRGTVKGGTVDGGTLNRDLTVTI